LLQRLARPLDSREPGENYSASAGWMHWPSPVDDSCRCDDLPGWGY
jgi:hypothetical protein